MHRGRIVLGAAAVVAGLLVAGVWLVPGLLDWNRYREEIASLASAQLGRPVHIGGAVSLQVLPQPILTASDITVDEVAGEGAGGSGVSLRARALRLRVGRGSLLAGRVDARELTLQGADLRLPWPPKGSLARRPPSWLTELQARVEDSRLEVGGLVFTGIDATVTTDAETGAVAAAGMGRSGEGKGERSWRFTARLSRPGGDGSAGLDISLDGMDALRDTGGTFSGQLGAGGTLAGRVAARGPDLSALMPAPAVAWRGDGRLTASGGLAVADELALEIGGSPARGVVALRVEPETRLDVALTTGRLDLDAWIPALAGRHGGTLRAGIPTGIDLSAEAATLAGGTLRQMRAGVDLTSGGALVLREASAVLPGEAALHLSNGVGPAAEGGATRFNGTMRLSAPDLRDTVRWVRRWGEGQMPGRGWEVLDAVPPEVLRRAELGATLMVGARDLALSGVSGTVDGSGVSGSLTVRGGERVGVSGVLTVDRLVLDPWVSAVEGEVSGYGALPLVRRVLAAARGVDAELSLRTGAMQWSGVRMGAAGIEVQTDAAKVTVRRFDASPPGMTVVGSGVLGEGRLSDGRLEVTAPELGRLRPMVEGALGAAGQGAVSWTPLLGGAGHLVAQAAGPVDALAGRIVVEAGAFRLEAQPVMNLQTRRWSGPVTLHHPGAPRVLETLGFKDVASWLGDGSLSLVGQMVATPGRVALEGVRLSAGSLRGSGQGWIEGRRLAGQVAFETLPLPWVSARSTEPLALEWLKSWQGAIRVDAASVLVGQVPAMSDAGADVALEGGELRLERVGGHVAGGVVSGSLGVNVRVEPPRFEVQGQVLGMGIARPVFGGPVDVVSGQADVSGDLSAEGHSPAAVLATLSGRAMVRVSDGVATGFDLGGVGVALEASDARVAMEGVRRAILAGETAFATIEAPLVVQRGTVAVDGVLSGTAGRAGLVGSVDVQGSGESLRLSLMPLVPGGDGRAAPALGLRLAGPADAPSRTPELSGLARWLADRAGP